MPASNAPQHGDAIIESREETFGGKKLVASFQFQRFLDSIGETQTEFIKGGVTVGDLINNYLTSNMDLSSKSLSKISITQKQLDALSSLVSGLVSENSKLRARVSKTEHSLNDAYALIAGG